MNRYLCTLLPIILGAFSLFVISLLYMDLTTVTIFAIVAVVLVWLLFSSASLTVVVLGRNLRILRERGYTLPE